MRISDWSSDVCSSDLFWHNGNPGKGSGSVGACQRKCQEYSSLKTMSRCVSISAVRWSGRATRSLRWIAARPRCRWLRPAVSTRSEEHTSELQSLMRISYAVFCLKKKKNTRYGQVLHLQL